MEVLAGSAGGGVAAEAGGGGSMGAGVAEAELASLAAPRFRSGRLGAGWGGSSSFLGSGAFASGSSDWEGVEAATACTSQCCACWGE